MQYMLLMYLDENSLSEAQRTKCYADSAGYARQLHASGKYVAAAPLQPPAVRSPLRFGTSEEKQYPEN